MAIWQKSKKPRKVKKLKVAAELRLIAKALLTEACAGSQLILETIGIPDSLVGSCKAGRGAGLCAVYK